MSGETEQNVSGWTVDTLHTHMLARLGDLRLLMDERAEAQRRAVDTAFAAQQAAMSAALSAAEKAVSAALVSAEKAVTKAEIATEKRIEGLNELRRVVNDIGSLQMPRVEAEQRIGAVGDSISELKDRVSRIESIKQGGDQRVTGIYAALAAAVAILTIIVMAANGLFSH